MSNARRTLIALLLIAPVVTSAQGRDAAYCAKLADLMNVYLGGDMGHATITDADAAIAIDKCQKGETAAGIPVLERKLRAAGYTLPAR